MRLKLLEVVINQNTLEGTIALDAYFFHPFIVIL
jgi:hypothetical protein